VITANADLHLTNSNSQHFAFGDLNIAFRDGSNRIPKQLPIQKEAARPVTCEISAHMTDELRAMFQLHETRRELVVTLFAHGQRSYPVRFAFDFGERLPARNETMFSPTFMTWSSFINGESKAETDLRY
jgi:hypothetical protein